MFDYITSLPFAAVDFVFVGKVMRKLQEKLETGILVREIKAQAVSAPFAIYLFYRRFVLRSEIISSVAFNTIC